jgi:oligopeptide transport system ATP-binding protein
MERAPQPGDVKAKVVASSDRGPRAEGAGGAEPGAQRLLEIRDLATTFKTEDGLVRAVNGLSFSVEAGTTLGIVGESGSGKSVTSLSIMRLIPQPPGKIERGEVLFKGRDLLQISENEMRKIRGRDIAMIFQDPMTSLNPVLTVGEQIAEATRLHLGYSKKEALEKAVEMLRLVKIPAAEQRIKDYPHQFSGGMRQRVMIAMALSCDPAVLIADEPTTALDVTIQAQIIELMNEMQQRLGSAIVLITHDLGVVAETCKNVLVMYGGNMVEYGSADDIFNRPKMPYTMGLLESLPRLDAAGDRLVPIEGQPPNLLRMPPGCAFAPRCRYKMPMCDEPVPLYDFGAGHVARCFLYDERAAGARTLDVENAPRVALETVG